MHARNRYPGNGYRSNPMMTGGTGIASRVSPENSMIGQRAHNYEFRNFDHGDYGRSQLRLDHGGYGRVQLRPDHGGYGRGQLRPDHGGYERGHLRADHDGGYGQGQPRPDYHGGYGQGLSRPDHGGYGRGQSRPDHGGYGRGQSKPDHGGYGQSPSRQFQRPPQERRFDVFMEAGRLAVEYLVSKGLMPPDVLREKWTSNGFDNHVGADVMQLPFRGRTSALSRLGSPVTDVGPGRRRHHDDYNSMSSNNTRDRRRSGSFRNSSPEGNREFKRSGSFSDRSRGSVVAVGEKVAFSSRRDERRVSNNGGGVSRNRTLELATQKDKGGTRGSSLEKHAKASSSSEKDLLMPNDVELLQEADEHDSHPEAGEINDEEDDCMATDDAISQEAGKVESVPSKTSSPMPFQDSKVVVNDITANADTFKDEPPKEYVSCANNMVVDSLPVNDDSSILQPDHLELSSKEEEVPVTNKNLHHGTPASIPEVDESSSKEQVTNEELPECVKVNSIEKRAMSEESLGEESKRCKISAASNMDYTEERQDFPSSFKTFELNLMEGSDMTGNSAKYNIPLFSSETKRGKQHIIPVNINLSSVSNDSRASFSNLGKCIEVVDFENETEQVGRDLNNSERSDRNENVFPCLDIYSNNNTQNGNDGSDVQDGYELMISELLGNDLPSCSSVSTDLSSLHSDMGLHSSE